MSSCPSNSDSDISSFAAWDAQNTTHPPISEREQSLLDMRDPQRMWQDRDSSNDARSSDESEMGNVEGLKRNGGGSKRKRMEIPSSTQGTETQGLNQFAGQELDAPPSSQPRHENSDKEEEDLAMGNTLPTSQTLLQEIEPCFDLSQTSFLSTLLPQTSPKTEHDLLQLKTSIQEFAYEHPFWSRSVLIEEEGLEFEGDVFEFAQAAGLSSNLAKVEVMRAMGKWKSVKGLGVGGARNKEGGGFGVVVQSIEGTKDVRGVKEGSGKKRKRGEKEVLALGDSSVVGEEGTSGQSISKRQRKRDKKRKLEGLNKSATILSKPDSNGHKQDGTPTPRSKKDQAKAENAKKELKPVDSKVETGKTADVAPPATKLAKEPKSTKRLKSERRKAKKLKAKQGPTTSSYFSAQTNAASSTSTVSMDIPPAREEAPLPEENADESVEQVTKDVVEEIEVPAEEKVIETDITELSIEGVDQKKKKRRRKRNHNRLPERVADERASRKLAQADKPKITTSEEFDAPKSVNPPAKRNHVAQEHSGQASVDGSKAAEQPAKKKRVRSRRITVGHGESNQHNEALSGATVPGQSDNEKPKTSADPDLNPVETDTPPKKKRRVRSKRGSAAKEDIAIKDDNVLGVGEPVIKSADSQDPVGGAEQKSPKEKSWDPEKKLEAQAEKPSAQVTAVPVVDDLNTARDPTEANEPAKKKPRNRSRKSVEKLLNVEIADAEAPPSTEPLVELPDTNSEEKKRKHDRSRKRSSAGSKVEIPDSEASNFSHS